MTIKFNITTDGPSAALAGRYASGLRNPLIRRAAVITILVAAYSTAAIASGKLYYGSRVGMTVSVVSVSGLNTANAVIRTRHTREDATTFCKEYANTNSSECISRELTVPLNDYVAANCKTGQFVDFYGNKLRYEGAHKAHAGDEVTPQFDVRYLSTGKVEDGTTASGSATNIGIFFALCPSRQYEQ